MRDFPDFVDIYPTCQPSAVLPDISLISLSIGSYLELAIVREDFSSVARVNVRFSWVFYFVFICCYKLNSPHNEMRTGPGLFSLGGFPDFPRSRFSSRMLVCWIQWGREGKIEAICYRRRLKIFENFLFFIISHNYLSKVDSVLEILNYPTLEMIIHKGWNRQLSQDWTWRQNGSSV